MDKDYCKACVIAFLLSISISANATEESPLTSAARNVMERLIGNRASEITLAELSTPTGKDLFEIDAKDGHLVIKGSSPVAMTYAFSLYLREACHCMSTWSGKHINIPDRWPSYHSGRRTSPYALRYFLNVCTFGYTTPYWDWPRWEQEIDWMALHGINMPLATVASEAVAERVWLKMGLGKEEINSFFTGPALLPWHRMGNLNSWDGPLDEEWHSSQILLQHKIIERMKSLGMHPVAPAFAGFVPEAFIMRHPNIQYTHLEWGGFDKKFNAYVLSPSSPFFAEIGRLFVEEWEREFGKNTYFLSDSFNEMRLPTDKKDTKAKLQLLSDYGEIIYKSIQAGDPDAVWVTQGWTFGYQHDFWDKASLQALLSKVPDDKMLIIDLGNDYPKWVWHTKQTWKIHNGFYGKQWVFSYVPNFGGKTALTGDMRMYATNSAMALNNPRKGNLVGFGAAPEGLENNEAIYELIADMGWTDHPIDLHTWIENYCMARYGAFPPAMRRAWNGFLSTCYSSLYSYPRFTWQTLVPDDRRISKMDLSKKFLKAIEDFVSCHELLKGSPLYKADALELSALYIGAKAEQTYKEALRQKGKGNNRLAQQKAGKAIEMLLKADRLLCSHPLHRLSRWVDDARRCGGSEAKKNQYEANAKRLITTWGGSQEDYAARFWSGLIKDYYVPRIRRYFESENPQIDEWEEKWINTNWKPDTQPYPDPLSEAVKMVNN